MKKYKADDPAAQDMIAELPDEGDGDIWIAGDIVKYPSCVAQIKYHADRS